MRPTGVVVLASAAFCLAVWLMATGWRQPRPSLMRSIRHHRRGPADNSMAAAPRGATITTRIGSLVMSTSVGEQAARWAQPLRLIGRSVPHHIGMLVAAAMIGLAAPTILLVPAQLSGAVSFGSLAPAAVALLVMLAAPASVHWQTMSRANEVRIDLRHQLSAYLDMVTMLLAGNTGHEGALEQAARAGDGMLFRELRRRMREVSATGHSLVGALARVGADFGVVELEQVADSTRLSAAEGAPVARTLAAKCSTLRSTLAAEQEARARVRNDKVTPPLVGMALLFMALIIYPALNLN